jgi:hypothetical protein
VRSFLLKLFPQGLAVLFQKRQWYVLWSSRRVNCRRSSGGTSLFSSMVWTTRESASRSWAWCGRGKHSRSRVEVRGGAGIGWAWKAVDGRVEDGREWVMIELDADGVCADGRTELGEVGAGLGILH